MPGVSFSCPKCGKSLKSAQPIPAGKKIKCPSCATLFAMPAQDDEELVAAKTSRAAARDDDDEAPPRRKARRDDDEDEEEKPRARKSSRDDDDEDEAPRKRKRSRDDDEDGEFQDRPRPHRRAVVDDEDEDEPRSRRRSRDDDDDDDDDDRPRIKRRRSSNSSKGLLIGVGAIVLVLLLVGGAIGAYFLWFAGVNRGSGKEDPLAYVPPGNNMLIGVKYGDLMDDATIRPVLEKAMREGRSNSEFSDFLESAKKETGLEFHELCSKTIVVVRLDGMDQAFMGGAGPGMGMGGPGVKPPTPPMTAIFQSSKPFNQKKLARAFKGPKQKSAHGKTYYEVNYTDIRTVFMPSDYLLIVSTLSASEMDDVFKSDGKTPSVSSDIASMAQSASDKTFWMVLPMEGPMRNAMDMAMKMGGGLAGNNGKGGNDPVKAVTDQFLKSKGISMWCDIGSAQVQAGMEIACTDNTMATLLVAGTNQSLNELKDPQKKAQLDQGLAIFNKASPNLGQLINELRDSFQYSADGSVFKISASAKRSTLTAVFEDVQKQMGGGAFAGGPANMGAGAGGPGMGAGGPGMGGGNPGMGGGGPGMGGGRGGNPGGGMGGGGRGGNPGGGMGGGRGGNPGGGRGGGGRGGNP